MHPKKQTTIRLDEEEISFLRMYGKGKVTQAIRDLITEKKEAIELGSHHQETPEGRFYDCLLLPTDARLRDTYCAFLELFIESGECLASLDFLAPALTGCTGFDEGTIRKHFRKLASLKFIKSEGLLFRPTIRVKHEVPVDILRKLYFEFADFLKARGDYRDVSVDLWDGISPREVSPNDQ